MACPLPRFLGFVGDWGHLLRRWIGLHPGWLKRLLFFCYLPIAAGSFILLWRYHKSFSDQLDLGWFGATVAFVFSVQKQKADELKLFADLFTRFNQQYEKLHEDLNKIRHIIGRELKEEEKSSLYKYFNLCGEEYLFYLEGFIHPKAWKAWKAGMQLFFENKHFADEWRSELKTDSYYGLEIGELEHRHD